MGVKRGSAGAALNKSIAKFAHTQNSELLRTNFLPNGVLFCNGVLF
jgi:hypothetical protein